MRLLDKKIWFYPRRDAKKSAKCFLVRHLFNVPHCLSLTYDEEFFMEMEEHIKERGILILTSQKVERIVGNGMVEKVVLSNGDEINAQIVILGIGAVAYNELAKKAKLRIGLTGGIEVDRTKKPQMIISFAAVIVRRRYHFSEANPLH